jgi:hypothetical protein
MMLRHTLGHDGPADRAQEPVDLTRRASVALAPVSLIGSGTHPSLHDAPIKENSYSLVSCERSLEMLVEIPAIAGDDDELPDPLRLVVRPVRLRPAPVKAPRAARRRGLL